jgi:hypothetical protein
MEINYPDYFQGLGFKGKLYDPAANQFEEQEIEDRTDPIIVGWTEKYPSLVWKASNIRYDSIISFNQSFLNEIQGLNFEGVK